MKYLTRDKIEALTGFKREWIRRNIIDMERSGRYPEDKLIKDGKLVLISETAFLDLVLNKRKLKNGELVPPYKKRRQL